MGGLWARCMCFFRHIQYGDKRAVVPRVAAESGIRYRRLINQMSGLVCVSPPPPTTHPRHKPYWISAQMVCPHEKHL